MSDHLKQRIAANDGTVTSLALGVAALGDLLASQDESAGMSDSTVRGLGYLLHEIGRTMTDKLNDTTRAELELAALNGELQP